VAGGFELAIWSWGGSGPMMKEGVGERAAELLVKKDKQESLLQKSEGGVIYRRGFPTLE